MNDKSRETAVILANGMFRTPFAKTAHGLVRGPCRYRIVGVIDDNCSGEDAGELLDGRTCGIPIFESVSAMLELTDRSPDYCVIGVATSGGVMPEELRKDLVDAARAGISLVSGLHRLLADDSELVSIVESHGVQIVDIRQPRPTSELRFWTGEVLSLETPRVAVLGTDCAVGKRTTASLLLRACRDAGLRAEMVFTGQTGWLQGYPYGFILDATPNDFVCGELESAILACQRETEPDLIFIEGQSSLRNPSGPCGSELILAGGASGVILQHAPARPFFDELEDLGRRIPPIEEEIDFIGLLGAEVWAVTLSEEGMTSEDPEEIRLRMAEKLGVPVVLPLRDDLNKLVKTIKSRIDSGEGAMRISGITSWGEAIPLLHPYEIASMRIDAVDLFFVRISTDKGVEGIGSASPAEDVTGESPEACRTALSVKQLGWLGGRDPRDLDELVRDLGRSHRATPAARAAVDMALHDLVARIEGVPLVDLLGRCHDLLPTSVTIGISSIEETIAEAEEHLGQGFRYLKVKTGRAFDEDVERLTKLRKRVGPEVSIRIDANQGYTVDEAGGLGDLADDLDLELIEQPLPATSDSELRTLPSSVRRIIAADESLHGEKDAQFLAEDPPACGIFNIKLMKCGGVRPALAIAEIAQSAGIDLMWGCNDESVVSIAAALHAAYACPKTRYLDLDGSFELARDPAKGGFVVEEGCLRLLDRPGLGVDLQG